MPLTKQQKTKIIEDLKEKIARQKAIVFGDISGVKVKDLTSLREEMKKNDSELKVAKKTLISKALKENGIEIDLKKIKGEVALGFGYQDEIAPFKALYELSKNNENLKIVSGLIGKEFYGEEQSLTLAKLPGRKELLGKMVGSLSSPLSGLVRVLQGNLRNFVYLLSELQKVKN
jgi:large subunit ribosomal protein L10